MQCLTIKPNVFLQEGEQDCVVDRIECRWEVEQNQTDTQSFVYSTENVIVDSY